MSAIHYTPLQLKQLSTASLKEIITDEGWRPQVSDDRLVSYILNMQSDKTRSLMLPNFSDGVVLAPIDEAVGALEDYYLQKKALTNQLLSLSDPALFAVVDRLGRDLVLSPPYARVDGNQVKDRIDLVWYLVGVLSQ